MSEDEERLGQDELTELEFLESLARRLPKDVETLKALGDLCTRVGRYEEGLAQDTMLCALRPTDPYVWYNLGCSLALLSRKREALNALTKAIRLGYRDFDWMNRDRDLQSLKDDQHFRGLLQQIAPQTP
jgi:Flp pilus assembly protein TadD